VVGAGNHVDSQGIDLELKRFLDDRNASKREIQVVDVHFDGRWAAVAGQESASAHASDRLQDRFRTNSINAHTASRFTFGLGDDYVVFCNGQSMPSAGSAIDAIEYDVGPRRTTLWRRMDEAKIPGLAIAIIEDNRITHVRGYGVLRDDIERQVLASTAFDLASMSKFPSALLAARLDELGIVDLDTDILESPGPIVSEWRQRGNAAESAELPAAISLRQLLSHTGGIRADLGSPGIHERYWDRLPLDIGDLLMGYRCDGILLPCRFDSAKRVWTDRAPGTMQQYANAGFLLAEAVVRDATGKTGADRLQKLIFEPLGLGNTSGAAPLPYALSYWAAWQHGQDGRRSGRTLYPWTFAGGIYASAGDYARMMILALDEGRDENGVQRIGATAIQQLLTRVLWNPGLSGKGLGLELILVPGTTPGTTTTRSFYHGGRHSGEARNEMCGNVRTGDGIVVLTNSDSDPDGADPVDQVIDEIIQTYVAAQDDWGADRCAQGPLPPPV
jgi:CubicO group peptidase (beta-lactamase class C family)